MGPDKTSRIVVAGNGPSAQARAVEEWAEMDARFFRCNYFLDVKDVLRGRCDDWLIAQSEQVLFSVVCTYMHFRRDVQIWVAGLQRGYQPDYISSRLWGAPIRVQRHFVDLPAGCRWDQDLAPDRPMAGSLAIAIGVGMQPAELYLCGHDLHQHPSGTQYIHYQAIDNARGEDRWSQYHANTAKIHSIRGDLRYIQAALDGYNGHLTCVGSVMKRHFADRYPQWEWMEG